MKRLLIANRGEIAVRIIRSARELGIETVAIYSEPDEGTLHVRLADKKIALRGAHVRDSYLNIDKVINAAIQSGADAVHPGYGFFSENPAFEKAVREAGLCFVGPKEEAMTIMADKARARKRVIEFGVPVVPGLELGEDQKELDRFIKNTGFPVLVKAAAGGGGRGMRVVENREQLESSVLQGKREALSSFGSDKVFLEKYISSPRHIEVQVFGDEHGTLLHFGERECSIQRRHQKLIEESPAPNLHPGVRKKILDAALQAAKSVNYVGAGTVEFLVEDGQKEDAPFYFLEMNTRIQVEHPVTEIVTNSDLVKLQLQVAQGERLDLQQKDVVFQGHAMEFRIYGENPEKGFQPSTGTIRYVSRSLGVGVREDSWIEAGTKVSSYYDSLLSKIIVFGRDRSETLTRARRLFSEYLLEGVENTVGFHRWILEEEDFKKGFVDVNWLERHYKGEVRRGGVVGPLELPTQ